MTSLVKNNEFINYLSILDSIHDFGKKRCQDGVESGASKYDEFIKYIKFKNETYKDRDDYRKFTSGMFEGKYANDWLDSNKFPIETIIGNNLFNDFKKIYKIGEKERYYTVHDAVYKSPVFNWNFKEGKTNSGDKYHVQIKIPHNSWDGATAATTKSFISSKGRIVLPYNTNKKTWEFTSNILTNNDNTGTMSFSYEKSNSFIYDIGPILRFKYIINGRKTTFKYESPVLSKPIEIKFNETGVILNTTSRGVLKKAKEQLNKFLKIFKKKKVQPQTYNVEKILDLKYVNKKPYYLVKWENYQDEDNTWEPEVNLTTEMIKAYQQGYYDDNDPAKLKGKVDAGPSVSSLCSVLLNEIDPSYSPCKSNDKDKLSITICEQIYKQLKGLKTSITSEHLYNLLLDIKRSGDWEQVNSTKWYSDKYPKQKVIFFTGDWLCFLYSVINNINTVYLGTKNSITYYIKNTYGGLKFRGGEKGKTINDDNKNEENNDSDVEMEDPEQETDSDVEMEDPEQETDNDVEMAIPNQDYDDYDYDEETDFDIELNNLFMSVLSDIRNITMKWHSFNDPNEQYYEMIRNIIIEFNDVLKIFPETKTSILNNVKGIIELFSLILDIESPNENKVSPNEKDSPGNKFTQTFLKNKFNEEQLNKYGYIGSVLETREAANTHLLKKIFLMSVCILYEMITIDVDFDYENVNSDLILTDENIIPEMPPILESLYYPILTDKIFVENEGSLSLFRNGSLDNIVKLLGINYNLLAYRILNTSISEDEFKNEIFSLQGFYTGRSKNVVLKSFYDSYKILVNNRDISVEKQKFISSAREFVGFMEQSTTLGKRGRDEDEQDDDFNTGKRTRKSSFGGGKTKKRTKKLKKTKKKAQKNKKTSLPKSKRKTKKNKKKKRNKTKIKKGGKKKRKKKKQCFEMSIKELKKYVNKKSKK